MGQNISTEPVVEKETERDHNDTFNVAVSSCQGWRMSQEDNHSMMLELPGEHNAAFFAVYDGHGSARVSKHASEGLWRHLVENDMYLKGNFEEALEQSFLTFDKEVNESYNAQLAGTTAVCLLIANNKIYCANIGDSRAVASVNCECIPMSYDHKPENPQELKRIIAAGGYVLGNRVNGNLALSRAFGDFHYKGNDKLPPEQQVVSSCPDVKTLDLNDDVDFLVLACDGIWDVLSSEEVVEFVISRLEENMEPGLICEQLTTRCLATDYELVIGCDNMTVLLVCYTRGRSWDEYCSDIFRKNSKRLGKPRIRQTSEQEKLSPSASTADASAPLAVTTTSSSTELETAIAEAIVVGAESEVTALADDKLTHAEQTNATTEKTEIELEIKAEAQTTTGGEAPDTQVAIGSETVPSCGDSIKTEQPQQNSGKETVTLTVSSSSSPPQQTTTTTSKSEPEPETVSGEIIPPSSDEQSLPVDEPITT